MPGEYDREAELLIPIQGIHSVGEVLDARAAAVDSLLNAHAAGRREGADFREAVVQENARLRAALRKIQEWDCLNPPDPALCCDHPWLKRIVDAALAGGGGEDETARLRAALRRAEVCLRPDGAPMEFERQATHALLVAALAGGEAK